MRSTGGGFTLHAPTFGAARRPKAPQNIPACCRSRDARACFETLLARPRVPLSTDRSANYWSQPRCSRNVAPRPSIRPAFFRARRDRIHKGSATVFRGCNSKEDTERTFAQAALRKQPWESPCQPVNLEAGDLRNIPPHGGMNRKRRRPPRGEKSVLHVTVELWTRETTARDA
jgi:hypothetical protein